MQLSPHFSLDQFTRSETATRRGIENAPDERALENLSVLALGLEQVRELLGFEIDISSAYRCPMLNAAVGGAAQSQHVLGLAADFVCPEFGPPIEIAHRIARSEIDFDQCILEFDGWVHLSFSAHPRHRVLSIYSSAQGYLEGLWDRRGNRWA